MLPVSSNSVAKYPVSPWNLARRSVTIAARLSPISDSQSPISNLRDAAPIHRQVAGCATLRALGLPATLLGPLRAAGPAQAGGGGSGRSVVLLRARREQDRRRPGLGRRLEEGLLR